MRIIGQRRARVQVVCILHADINFLQPQVMCTERQLANLAPVSGSFTHIPFTLPIAPPSLTPAAISRPPLRVSMTMFYQSEYACVNVTTTHVKTQNVSRLELPGSPRVSKGLGAKGLQRIRKPGLRQSHDQSCKKQRSKHD